MSLLTRLAALHGPARVALGFLLLVTALALAAPWLFPAGAFAIVGKPFLPIGGPWLLGTDSMGRDVAAQLAYGARTSLAIGLVSSVTAVVLGSLIGAVAGYYGRRIDDLLMRLVEFFQTIPAFLFAIVLIALMSTTNTSIVVAIAMVSWAPVARLVRGEFMRLRHQEFVLAAVSLGMRDREIVWRQILPNAMSPIIVTGSLMVATAILTEAALSFLGLGDPNAMSWGFMIGAGRSFLRDAWWLCTIPGIAIVLTVLSINLVGEALNDAINPRHWPA